MKVLQNEKQNRMCPSNKSKDGNKLASFSISDKNGIISQNFHKRFFEKFWHRGHIKNNRYLLFQLPDNNVVIINK